MFIVIVEKNIVDGMDTAAKERHIVHFILFYINNRLLNNETVLSMCNIPTPILLIIDSDTRARYQQAKPDNVSGYPLRIFYF